MHKARSKSHQIDYLLNPSKYTHAIEATTDISNFQKEQYAEFDPILLLSHPKHKLSRGFDLPSLTDSTKYAFPNDPSPMSLIIL